MLLTQITYLRGCLRSPAWTAAGKETGEGNKTGRTDGWEGRQYLSADDETPRGIAKRLGVPFHLKVFEKVRTGMYCVCVCVEYLVVVNKVSCVQTGGILSVHTHTPEEQVRDSE